MPSLGREGRRHSLSTPIPMSLFPLVGEPLEARLVSHSLLLSAIARAKKNINPLYCTWLFDVITIWRLLFCKLYSSMITRWSSHTCHSHHYVFPSQIVELLRVWKRNHHRIPATSECGNPSWLVGVAFRKELTYFISKRLIRPSVGAWLYNGTSSSTSSRKDY